MAPTREPSLLEILRTPGILRATLVGASVLSSIDIVVIYLPALGQERLWSVGLVGTLLALRAGSSLAVRLVLGSLAGRFGRQPLLLGSMAVSAGALLVLPFLHAVPLVAVAMIAAGAGLGVGQPLSVAWVASAAPPHARATALSIRIMGNGVGRITLPVAAGTMAAMAGAGGVLGVTGAVLAASAVAVAGGRRRPRAPLDAPPPVVAR
jgi:MFS family permease